MVVVAKVVVGDGAVVGDGSVVVVVATVVCDVVGVAAGEVVGASSWPVQAVTTASKTTSDLRIDGQGIPYANVFENA